MKEEKILASVAGEAVTESDVDEAIASMGARASAYGDPKGRAAMLEQLINKKLLLLDAKRNLFERDEEFKAQLAKVKEELLSNYAIEKAIRDVKVSDGEIESFYEEHKNEFVSGERINVSHILTETKEEAESVLEKIKSGNMTFEEAARRYSSCPSKEQGGLLGDAGRGQFVPEFENAAFEAVPGELTGPVETQFGYHIIRVNEKIPGGIVEFDKIAGAIAEKLLSEKQQKAYQSKINQLKIMYMVDRF